MKLLFSVVAAVLLLVASAANAQALQGRESVWTPEFPLPTDTRAAKPSYTTIPLFGNISSLNLFNFYGEVSIGTPPQKFKLLFDTKQPFVSISNFKAPASHHAFYDHNKSSSYEADGVKTRSYGVFYSYNGYVEGHYPHSANFADSEVDGMFGLGPNLYHNDVFQWLLRSGALDVPVITLYFNKSKVERNAPVASDGGPDSVGEITIGAIDKRRYTGDIHYVDMLVPHAWTVDQVAGTIGNESFGGTTSSTTRASIMSSWPFISGPLKEVDKLARAVGANDIGLIDCSSEGPDIVIRIGGVQYTLTKDHYTIRINNNHRNVCRWVFLGVHLDNLWWIGQPFLQKFYTVFEFGDDVSNEKPRLGFALAT